MMKILGKMLFKILFGPEKDFDIVLENLAPPAIECYEAVYQTAST